MGRNLSVGYQDAASLLAEIVDQLPDNGLDDRRRDARLLLGMALGRDDAVLPHEDICLAEKENQTLSDLIARRQQGEPISRIRGWREFYSLKFQINAATLDPRPDSETLVDAVINDFHMATLDQPRLLDLGTGSGCLLLACLHHLPNADGVGVDVQPGAVDMARQNAETLGLTSRAEFIISDWDHAVEGRFDVIISNPPYIPTSDILTLMDEVRDYDPALALDGGGDGLDAWRKLAPIMAQRLRPDGAVFLEIGQGQDDDVCQLFHEQGLNISAKHQDLSGINRCLEFRF